MFKKTRDFCNAVNVRETPRTRKRIIKFQAVLRLVFRGSSRGGQALEQKFGRETLQAASTDETRAGAKGKPLECEVKFSESINASDVNTYGICKRMEQMVESGE